MNVAETTPHASEAVTAIYELPVPIWVSCAALGGTYPSGYGRVQFDVVMPQDHAPVGAPPVIDGVEVPESFDGELIAWTTKYAAWIPKELQPATALRRIVITAVEAPTDTARAWRGPDQQLGEFIKFWFDQVRSWVEILTGQDLDPGHRVYDSETVGAGLTFMAPPREGDLGVRLTTRHIQPVSAAAWRGILAAVRDGMEPPLERLLIRDAHAAFARAFYRRAVIDAAAALEIALVRVLDERVEDLPERQRERLEGGPTLGISIDIAKVSGFEFEVPFEDLKRLNKARNDAVHRAQAPDYSETLILLEVAGNFLESSVRVKDASAGTD
jgi:hypothetical protein